MTPEAQRTAIAEACGWVWVRKVNTGQIVGLSGPAQSFHRDTPDYLSDLNAMAEAEKFLTGTLAESYVGELEKLPYLGVFATADQRAEAFLKTIGKWDTK